ncbi:MAG: glycerol-3-phosphate acyltransferase [Lysobacter sp.]|nr:glycerol-3-phosphate acyltransferase [Lysobacter sp.]MDQ3269539.1 glycerol-3-phosphate acyltransferase [Pseudomonadota bacterium]
MLPLSPIAPISVLLIAGAYLIGSLSGARLLRALAGRLPAAEASGESHWFTAVRVAFDLAKGAIAVWLALRHAPVGDAISVTAHGYVAAFATLAGHVWPLWHRFRGGGGTAALAGSLLVLWPVAAIVWLMAGLLVWWRSAHAGLAVAAGALVLPLLAWWTAAEPPRLWFALASTTLLLLAHRENLRRLWTGTEPRFAQARRLHRWRRR